MDLSIIRETAFSPTVLWIIWGLVFVAWIVMSAIFMYHWSSYSSDDPKVRRMKVVYFVGSLLLLASATTFIFSI